MTHADDRDELMIAYDEWEAAADALHLLMADRARGLAVDLDRLEHARRTLTDRQARWDSLASRVQSIVRRQASC